VVFSLACVAGYRVPLPRTASPACSRSQLPVRTALCRMCDVAEPKVAEEAAVAEAPVAAEAVAAEAPKGGKGPKTPLDALEVGTTVEGTVRSVMAYGAFVDVKAATDGLLHVSEICNEFVKDANDKLKAGDVISCRIKSVNLEKKQLALSCKDESEARAPRGGGGRARPDLSEYATADAKVFVKGTVNSIQEYGAFVTLKEGVDGLVHISQIQASAPHPARSHNPAPCVPTRADRRAS